MRMECKVCWGGLRVLAEPGWMRVVCHGQGWCELIDARDSAGALPIQDRFGWSSCEGAVPIIVHGRSEQLRNINSSLVVNGSLDELIESIIGQADVVIVPLGYELNLLVGKLEGDGIGGLLNKTEVVSQYPDFSEYISNPFLAVGDKVLLSDVLESGDRWVILGRRDMWRVILEENGLSANAIVPYWHESLSVNLGFDLEEAEEFAGVCDDLQVLTALEPRLHASELECLVVPESSISMLKGDYPYGALRAARFAVEMSARGCVGGVFGTEFGYGNFLNIVTCRSMPKKYQKQLMGIADLVI